MLTGKGGGQAVGTDAIQKDGCNAIAPASAVSDVFRHFNHDIRR